MHIIKYAHTFFLMVVFITSVYGAWKHLFRKNTGKYNEEGVLVTPYSFFNPKLFLKEHIENIYRRLILRTDHNHKNTPSSPTKSSHTSHPYSPDFRYKCSTDFSLLETLEKPDPGKKELFRIE